MATVYNDFNEREIRARVFYVNASKLYEDDTHKVAATHDDVLDACRKGTAQIFETDTFYTPTSFKDAGGTLTVGYNSKTVTVSDPS